MKISIGKSCWDTHWKEQDVSWEQLVAKLSKPHRTHETQQEYRKMSRDQQGRIKDIGGFVGGTLQDGKRSKNTVLSRSLITLDADYAQDTETFWDVTTMLMDSAMAIYSTHKHTSAHPRLRLVIPLAREVSPDEYEAISRKIAEWIEIEWFDDTTYQPSRLMYWPSCSKDGEYVFKQQEGPLLDPDTILAEYADWHDVSEWPISSREQKVRKNKAATQEDPLTKTGMVGAFCRTYTIAEAIAEYLSEVYLPTGQEDRYTYAMGSSAAGLVVYESKFAYSNHATDPAGGHLCNAFDLVRIHLYGSEDPEDTSSTPALQMPSYKKMVELASRDDRVKRTLVMDKAEDFAGLDMAGFTADQTEPEAPPKAAEILEEEEYGWVSNLELTPKGGFAATRQNVVEILNHDPGLKGRIAYDELAQMEIATGDLPWRKVASKAEQYLRDSDDACLRIYLETRYKGTDNKDKVHDAVQTVGVQNSFHPIKRYLKTLEWDGKPRVDRLLIDYLGATSPEEYTKAVTRKTLVAAVARVMEPGCKFDQVLTINGPQGVGKSTIFAKLGMEWFSDSIGSLNGDKNAMEALQGVWIMELGELDAMKKSETSAVKMFISKREDSFRSAYARRKETRPRQLIFVATTNETGFLRDETGARRWWVVDVKGGAAKSIWKDLTQEEVDQVWAEAYQLYLNGEDYHSLPPELEMAAKGLQEDHHEETPKLGIVKDFLELKLPADWKDRSLEERRVFIHGSSYTDPEEGTVVRDRICAAEIWCELFQKELPDMRRTDTQEINALLSQIPGWERVSTARFGRIYGTQRGFRRSE